MRIGNRDVIMWSWHNGDDGAERICKALGINMLLKEGSRYQWKPDTLCFGWGNSKWPEQYRYGDAAMRKRIEASFINKPTAVAKSCNKISSFEGFDAAGVRTPDWTDSQREAAKWRRADPRLVVVARGEIDGMDGKGLKMVDPGVDLPAALLYTKYIPYDMEFRVTVFRGKVIDVCRKVFKNGADVPDRRVRITSNGILFQRDDIYCPEDAKRQAIRATEALGLDFAGVDVVTKGETAYVLETNTAPEIFDVLTNKFAAEVRKLCA